MQVLRSARATALGHYLRRLRRATNRPSLALRLVLLIAAVTIAAGGLVGLLAMRDARDALRDEVLESNRATADLAAAFTGAYMHEQQVSMGQLAMRPSLITVVAGGDFAAVEAELAHWIGTHSRFDDVSFFNLAGVCRATSGADVGCVDISAADRDWFESLVTSRQPSMAGARRSRVTEQPVVWYGVPVGAEQGQVRGVLVGAISLAALDETLLKAQAGPTSRVGLSDLQHGLILLHPDPSRVLERASVQNEAWRRMAAGERVAIENVTSRGEATLAAVAPVPGLPWGIMVQEPSDSAFAPVQAMAERSAWSISLVTLLAATAGCVVALWLTRPLIQLRRTAEALARGELDQRVGGKRQDEIGQLGRAFDHMALELDRTLTALRQSEQKFQRERATLAAVMEGMTDGLLVISGSGQVLYANECAERLLGVEPRTLVGASTEELAVVLQRSTADPAATLAAWEQARTRQDEHSSFDLGIVGPPYRDVRVQCFPVADRTHLRMGVLLHDTTAERELLRAKDELTSMISHELASPASNLVTYAELLAGQGRWDSEQQEMLTAMVGEGKRLTTIIQDFLDVKRLEQGRLHIAAQPTDLTAILKQAARVARAHSDHPLILELSAALPLVQADAGRVQQVVANLLSNARKYTPAGGQVRLAARKVQDAVEVSVIDEGLGIPVSALPRLFDKFYRVESADRQTIKGNGLGLAICKELIEAHGGRIGAESAGAGRGSRFWFTLPLAAQAATELAAAQSAPRPVNARQRILAVDDDQMVRTATTRLLRREGHHVSTAGSVEEALEKLSCEAFDVVLSDLGLGAGSDGYALARHVRQYWPDVQFVLASGSTDIDPTAARAQGVDHLLPKPYRPEDLRRLLTQIASGIRKEAAA